MRTKLLIVAFIFTFSNTSFSNQDQTSDPTSTKELNQKLNIAIGLSKGIITPLENCANLFMGAYGSKNQYPKSELLPLDAMRYLHASRDLQTLLVQYVQELEMEDLLQSFDENLKISATFRIGFDEAVKGNQDFIPLIKYNMKTCQSLVSLFSTMSDMVLE